MTNITETQETAIQALVVDQDGMVDFGEMARSVLSQQCQYASYYVSGVAGRPRLADDLRVDGDEYNYHSLRIHQDDVRSFVERVNTERNW